MDSLFYRKEMNDFTTYSCCLRTPNSIEVAKAFEEAAAKM
tara:strand:+ start:4757 stop:4876 length:120 start_codon:yes stop_codon:yes gene_type:complete